MAAAAANDIHQPVKLLKAGDHILWHDDPDKARAVLVLRCKDAELLDGACALFENLLGSSGVFQQSPVQPPLQLYEARQWPELYTVMGRLVGGRYDGISACAAVVRGQSKSTTTKCAKVACCLDAVLFNPDLAAEFSRLTSTLPNLKLQWLAVAAAVSFRRLPPREDQSQASPQSLAQAAPPAPPPVARAPPVAPQAGPPPTQVAAAAPEHVQPILAPAVSAAPTLPSLPPAASVPAQAPAPAQVSATAPVQSAMGAMAQPEHPPVQPGCEGAPLCDGIPPECLSDPYAELRRWTQGGRLWPYCLLCSCWSESAHVAGKKHTGRLTNQGYQKRMDGVWVKGHCQSQQPRTTMVPSPVARTSNIPSPSIGGSPVAPCPGRPAQQQRWSTSSTQVPPRPWQPPTGRWPTRTADPVARSPWAQ